MAKGDKIQCFLLTPTDRGEAFLRRYTSADAAGGYHTATVIFGEVPMPIDGTDGMCFCEEHELPHDDKRWPQECSCHGQPFGEGGHWQHDANRLYRGAPGGGLVTLDSAPVGAMWYAPWYESTSRGPDGKSLVVKTPGGDWLIDSRASDGGRWTRTGGPPNVTVRPSIGIGGRHHAQPRSEWKYHGFLTDGVLLEL